MTEVGRSLEGHSTIKGAMGERRVYVWDCLMARMLQGKDRYVPHLALCRGLGKKQVYSLKAPLAPPGVHSAPCIQLDTGRWEAVKGEVRWGSSWNLPIS